MRQMRDRQLGSALGRCLRCGEIATLTVVEHRYVRRWTELFDTRFDAAASRTASCSACASTYPVRRTDLSAVPAAARQRRDALDVPQAREWRHTPVQV